MINEKLINKININLSSYTVNEADANTKYDKTQVLSSNSYFATPNSNSATDSPITPQTPLKDSETPSAKSNPNFTCGFKTATKKTIENTEKHNIIT